MAAAHGGIDAREHSRQDLHRGLFAAHLHVRSTGFPDSTMRGDHDSCLRITGSAFKKRDAIAQYRGPTPSRADRRVAAPARTTVRLRTTKCPATRRPASLSRTHRTDPLSRRPTRRLERGPASCLDPSGRWRQLHHCAGVRARCVRSRSSGDRVDRPRLPPI